MTCDVCPPPKPQVTDSDGLRPLLQLRSRWRIGSLRFLLPCSKFGLDDLLGEIAHRAPRPAAVIAKPQVGLLFCKSMPLHENTLRPFDEFTSFELPLHFKRLVLETA